MVIAPICKRPAGGYSGRMKLPQLFKRPSEPAAGNPANPSFEERERMIAKNKKKEEPVKKLPADELRRPAQD